jgi:hypothetical protein
MFTQVFIYFMPTLPSAHIERKKYFRFFSDFFRVIQSSHPDPLMDDWAVFGGIDSRPRPRRRVRARAKEGAARHCRGHPRMLGNGHRLGGVASQG